VTGVRRALHASATSSAATLPSGRPSAGRARRREPTRPGTRSSRGLREGGRAGRPPAASP
jgi:hypothetical protein